MTEDKVLLELTRAEALVLYGFLSRFSNKDELKIEDQAEERVLWDIDCMLERVLVEPFMDNYDDFLEEAREKVRDQL